MRKLPPYLLLFFFCTGCQPTEEMTPASNTQNSSGASAAADPPFETAIGRPSAHDSIPASPAKPLPKPRRTVHYRITLVNANEHPDICRINNHGDVFVDGVFYHKGHPVALEDKSPDPTRPCIMPCDFNDRGEVIGNLTGDVSGAYTMYFSQVVIWRHGRLSVPPHSTCIGETEAVRINNRGDILVNTFENGASVDPTSNHVFLLYHQGQVIDLGIGHAICLNNRGQVILEKTTEEQFVEAAQQSHGKKQADLSHDQFLWEHGHLVPLALPEHCEAILMNDHNQFIGQKDMGQSSKYQDYFNITRGFVWRSGHLETIKSLGGESSHALGMNNHGQVVGSADVSVPDSVGTENTHAFLYSHKIMRDLNYETPDKSGWILTKASDINNRSQIVGSGNKGVFLLTPIHRNRQ